MMPASAKSPSRSSPSITAHVSGWVRKRWPLVVAAIAVMGLGITLTSAGVWRSRVSSRDRTAFNVTASDVTQTLGTLLLRDADFVTAERAVLTMEPRMSVERFDRWFVELQGEQQLAGGLGALVVARVPASELVGFEARRDLDPAFRALVGGTPAPIAQRGGEAHCLLAGGDVPAGLSRPVLRIVQGDWCLASSLIGGSEGPLLQAQTDTGQLFLSPATGQGVNTILFEESYYSQAVSSLVTAAQRRAASAGWVLTSFDIPAIMTLAAGQHRGLEVSLYHTNPGAGAQLIGRTGRAPSGALTHTTTLDIGGVWTVAVSGLPVAGGLSANAAGLLLILVGLVVSALVCALVVVFARSRERAMGLVDEKTGQLRHQALHDSLTGLPNRVLALDRAQQMLARARRQHIPIAALYIDIDGFKHVNDSFGHAAGDELLQMVASRLLTVVREGDTAARLGGDEFVVLVDGSTLDSGAELVAGRLLAVLREPYDLTTSGGRRLTMSASIGIAVGPRADADELLSDADLALYTAKNKGRNQYALFAPRMQVASRERLTMEMDLADALRRRELSIVYQPVFDLRSECVIGMEALVRWEHPVRGVLMPDEFIPVAETSGAIIPIGRWVLHEACRQAAEWRNHGHEVGVAVNVSAMQLRNDGLLEDVRGALRRSGLDAQSLTLEITETALMRDADDAAQRLARLKALGLRIAIDDFGTGYSSIAYLRRFPVDALKLDRSFIDGDVSSPVANALIHTVVELGRALGMQTLAEGIEDEEQLEMLQSQHCDQGQGFLLCRPLDADAVERFLALDPRAALVAGSPVRR